MNPVSLGELRQGVRLRLRDFTHTWDALEIDAEINHQLDLFTRDTELVQGELILDISANSNPQKLTPLAGYQIGRILTIKINQDGQDVANLDLLTPVQADQQIPDWRNPNTTDSVPLFAILDFNATTYMIAPNALWLYPWPNTTLPSGLVITHVMLTDGLLKQDTDQIPLETWAAKEFLIESTCGALMERMQDARAGGFQARSMRESSRANRVANASRTTDRSARVYWV